MKQPKDIKIALNIKAQIIKTAKKILLAVSSDDQHFSQFGL